MMENKIIYNAASDMSTTTQSVVSALTFDLRTEYGQRGATDDDQQFTLFGRQKEVEFLEGCLERVFTTSHTELLLIYGRSGIGKTALAESLIETCSSRGAYFAQGKFDQFQWSNLPYVAICDCLTNLIDSLDDLDRRQRVRDAMGDNVFLLTPLLRNLELLAGLCGFESSTTYSMNHAFRRVQLSFCSLLKALATPQNPIVLLLDDVHWADPASLQIIKSILADASLKHVLLIITCRDDGKDNFESFMPNADAMHVTEIRLSDLNQSDTCCCTASILQEESPSIAQLADILHTKTNGNPYFLQQFIALLQKKELLTSQVSSFDGIRRWSYESDLVEYEAHISGNVLEVMDQQLQRLHPIVCHLLQIAVCLGRGFSVDILEILMDATKSTKSASAAIHEILQVAASLGHSFSRMTTELIYGAVEHHSLGTIDESNEMEPDDCFSVPNLPSIQVAVCLASSVKGGMLKKDGDLCFEFSHDRVQQAICESLGDSKLDKHLAIGRILRQNERFTPENPSFFLLVVDQLNAGCNRMVSDDDIVSLVSLNVEAAAVAAELSGYMSAQRYLRQALSLQPHQIMWEEEYELMLECCTAAAEMELACGNYEQANSYVDKVFQNVRSDQDRLQASFTKVSSLIATGSMSEARALTLQSLQVIGHKFPSNPKKAHVVSELNRTNNMMSNVPDDKLADMFPMCMAAHITETKLLRLLAWAAFSIGDGETMAIAALRIIQLTILNGFSDSAPLALAMCGVIHSSCKNFREARRMGQLSLKGLERVTDTHIKAGTHLILWSFVMHWGCKLWDVHDGAIMAYESAKMAGDSDLTFACAINTCVSSFLQGREKLSSLKLYISNITDEMVHYECLDSDYNIYRIVLQAVSNLSGSSFFPWKLTGEVMAEEIMLQQATESKHLISQFALWLVKLQLCAFFNQWSMAEEVFGKIGENHRSLQPHFSHLFYWMFSALTLTVRFNETKKRKYRRPMKRAINELKMASDAGIPICESMFALLLAEESASAGNQHATLAAYDFAALGFGRELYFNYQALTYERAARNATLSYPIDAEHQKRYLLKAKECYELWGAKRKVELLDEEIKKL